MKDLDREPPLAGDDPPVGGSYQPPGIDPFKEAFAEAVGTGSTAPSFDADKYAAAGLYDGWQGDKDTCALHATAHLLENVKGTDVRADDIIAQAQSQGIYSEGRGTHLSDLESLIESNGVPATYYHEATPGQIIYALHEGRPVILGVDAAEGHFGNRDDLSRGVLWNEHWTPDQAVNFRGLDLPDHAVVLKGLEVVDGSPQITYADSAPYGDQGSGAPYAQAPLAQILDACDGGGCGMVVSDVPVHTREQVIELPAGLRDTDFGQGSGAPQSYNAPAVVSDPSFGSAGHQDDFLAGGQSYQSGRADQSPEVAGLAYEQAAAYPSWQADTSATLAPASYQADTTGYGGREQPEPAAELQPSYTPSEPVAYQPVEVHTDPPAAHGYTAESHGGGWSNDHAGYTDSSQSSYSGSDHTYGGSDSSSGSSGSDSGNSGHSDGGGGGSE